MRTKKNWLPETILAFFMFARNFCGLILLNATLWGISSEDKSKTTLLLADLEDAQKLADTPQTRTAVTIDAAKKARDALKKHMKFLRKAYVEPGFAAGIISEHDYMALGLNPNDHTYTAQSLVPETVPIILELIPMLGHRVKIRFRDETSDRSEARPYGMNGCLANFTIGGEKVEDIQLLTQTELMNRSPYTLAFTQQDEGKFLSIAARWQNISGKLGSPSAILHVVIP